MLEDTSIRAREAVLVGLAALGFGLAFSYPLLGRITEAGVRWDWDLMRQLDWVAVHSVRHFHQFPFWNPYKCGGMPLLGNPSARIVTPFFFLHLLFGPDVGINLEVPLHLAIGWSGGYVFGRVLGLSRTAAVTCASIFPGSSWLSLHFTAGHFTFLPYLYLPWVAALTWLGIERRRLRFAALAGLLIALMLGEGGVYPASHSVVLVMILTLVATVQRRSLWPTLGVLTIGGFALGFAAFQQLPVFALMRAHARTTVGTLESYAPGTLARALFSREQSPYAQVPGIFDFHEYGAYVGVGVGALALIGAVASPRRLLAPLIAAVSLFLLATGDLLGKIAPWHVLHQLPIFSFERVTPRFLIPLTLMLGVLAAFGIEFLRTRLPARLVALLVAAVVLDLWLVGPPSLRYALAGTGSAVIPNARFRQFDNAGVKMLPRAKANVGVVSCHEPVPIRVAATGFNRESYRGEEYLLGPGSVRLLAWTPNALTYEIDAPTPTVLVVNQNHDRGWRLAGGEGEVISEGGLLAARLPAGTRAVTLVYRSPGLLFGLAATTCTLLALLGLWRFETSDRPRRRREPRQLAGADPSVGSH